MGALRLPPRQRHTASSYAIDELGRMGAPMASESISIDILVPAVREADLRKEIRNICDSYSHPWDALADSLCQNSVDAVRRSRASSTAPPHAAHHVTVSIDAANPRSIEVR